jgi:hypothetical protein
MSWARPWSFIPAVSRQSAAPRLESIFRWVGEGRITPYVSHTFPLVHAFLIARTEFFRTLLGQRRLTRMVSSIMERPPPELPLILAKINRSYRSSSENTLAHSQIITFMSNQSTHSELLS